MTMPRYLIEASIDKLTTTFGAHPVPAGAALAVVYGLILALLRWWFDDLDYDAHIFALVLTGIAVFVVACLYTLLTGHGYRAN